MMYAVLVGKVTEVFVPGDDEAITCESITLAVEVALLEPPVPVKHTPLTEKQPFEILMPPVPEKVVVAPVKLTTLLIAKMEPGVVEPIPTYPF